MAAKTIIASALLGGVMLSSTALAAGPSAEALAGTCAACHGTLGSSVGITPSLAGMTSDYFVETMQAFKNGERKATVMDRVAKGYSDEEIQLMGGYFAQQKLIPIKQKYDAQLAQKGAGIHKDQCEKCHEDNGRKSDDGGILAGQATEYLRFSMEDFSRGDRDMPKKMKKRMEKVKAAHGKAGVDALLNFYASQQ